jgi:hypothetical protein
MTVFYECKALLRESKGTSEIAKREITEKTREEILSEVGTLSMKCSINESCSPLIRCEIGGKGGGSVLRGRRPDGQDSMISWNQK